MAATCSNCGKKLGLVRRATGGGLCAECADQKRQERDEARQRYERVLADVAQGEMDASTANGLLRDLEPLADYDNGEITALRDGAFRQYAQTVMADDILTAQEEERLMLTGSTLGIVQADMETRHRDIFDRLVVAQVNDGRLPVMPSPQVMTKRGEDVHAETVASLLKEVTVKQHVGGGGYHGVGIPLGKGFRYYTGGARGHTVTRKEIQVADTGVLSVTSKRVVFTGNSGSTIEVPYSRLLKLHAFEDGLQLHVSGRKSAPLFQLEHVDPIAAMVGAAAERAQAD